MEGHWEELPVGQRSEMCLAGWESRKAEKLCWIVAIFKRVCLLTHRESHGAQVLSPSQPLWAEDRLNVGKEVVFCVAVCRRERVGTSTLFCLVLAEAVLCRRAGIQGSSFCDPKPGALNLGRCGDFGNGMC